MTIRIDACTIIVSRPLCAKIFTELSCPVFKYMMDNFKTCLSITNESSKHFYGNSAITKTGWRPFGRQPVFL